MGLPRRDTGTNIFRNGLVGSRNVDQLPCFRVCREYLEAQGI